MRLCVFPFAESSGVHNNYQSSVVVPNVSNQFTVKTDFVLSDKQRLTFSYSRKDKKELPVLFRFFAAVCRGFQRVNQTSVQYRAPSTDYTITSPLLNHLNIGYTYYDVGNLNSTYPFDTSSLGIPRNATSNLAFPLIVLSVLHNSNEPRYSADIGGVDFPTAARRRARNRRFRYIFSGRQTINSALGSHCPI